MAPYNFGRDCALFPGRRHRTLGQHAALTYIFVACCYVSYATAQTTTKENVVAQPDYTIYHTEEALMDQINGIIANHASILQMDTHERESDNYTANLEVITADMGSGERWHAEKLRSFGEHARELISSEVGLRLLQLLTDPVALKAQLTEDQDATIADQIMRLMRCCVVMKILPLENHGGRKVVQQGRLCERKNGHGVDPNRNWEVDWGKKERDYDPKEEFPGTAPFSEPETAMVRDVAEDFQPHVWINVHSGMNGIFMPYDHRPEVANGKYDNETLALMHQLNEGACEGDCVVGSGGASVGYLAHGTATDYMFEKLHVPVAMTWEIYGDEAAHFRDCFKLFNPLTQYEYDSTVRRWTTAVFETIFLMVAHPAVAQLQLKSAVPGLEHVKLATSQEITVDVMVSGLTDYKVLHHDMPDAEQLAMLDNDQLGYRSGVATLAIAFCFLVVTIVLWWVARQYLLPGGRKRKHVSSSLRVD